MINLNDKELMSIEGGASNWLTAAFVNATARAINTVLDVGRSLGSAIRRVFSGKVCSV